MTTVAEIAAHAIDAFIHHMEGFATSFAKQQAIDDVEVAFQGVEVIDTYASDDASSETFDPGDVMAYYAWPDNSHLVFDVMRLGYLKPEWTVWDATYGKGVFWKKWRPDNLVGTDLNPAKSDKIVGAVDFTSSPWDDRLFDVVVLDPPYRLNGTPDQDSDDDYGTETYTKWQERMDIIKRGVVECARVADKYLLVKCQDQVSSGKVRWQSDEIVRWAAECGFGKKDLLHFINDSFRGQPGDRVQRHARRNASQMLVFKRGWKTSHEDGSHNPAKEARTPA